MAGPHSRRQLDPDAWAALVLLGLCAVFLTNLLSSDATGAYVTSTTMPIAVVVVMAGLAVLLLGGSVLRMVRTAPQQEAASTTLAAPAPGLDWRVPMMVAWLVVYIAALPWLGYLVASGAFLIGAGLLYGNRRWWVLIGSAVVLPGLLLLFFEKVMIVLLPAARLWN
uniref:tripartite tricarboxylate transporter TctB family protein n=1 Tax=Pararhizobium sp. IMCC3301 TaxID=3067904 RepID=UPI0027408BF1|nr:tripartite tricarboxylate transporter TctB family protein [Pararhizobium sp. IMCC3301]